MDYYIICYDTPSDKRRRKLSGFLVNYISRVQHSVFEGYLKKHDFKKLERSLKQVIVESEDSLRIHIINEAQRRRMRVFGDPGLIQNPSYLVVAEEEYEVQSDIELEEDELIPISSLRFLD